VPCLLNPARISLCVATMRNRCSSVIFLLALATSPHVAASARVGPAKAVLKHSEAVIKSDDAEAPCWGCSTYPEAPDYADNWLTMTELGLWESVEALQAADEQGYRGAVRKVWADGMGLGSNFGGGKLSDGRRDSGRRDSEQIAALKLNWDMAIHAIINTMQGQACLDLCAVCMPSPKEMATADSKFKTIHISRSKNWQNASIWPVTGIVDTALGAPLGAMLGLPLAVTKFFRFVPKGYQGNKTASSFAGNILGAIAGISSAGVLSGGKYLGAIQELNMAAGIWKGVGLTAATTDCKRVGFERFHGGGNLDLGSLREQPFTSKPRNPDYGLKRLRWWMEDNKDWKQDTAKTEIHAGDPDAIKHCERVRDHSFDVRHASECLTHSQLCGSGGSLILPVDSAETCKAMSDVEYLEKKAVQLGDTAQGGLFAQWRTMQEQIKKATGYDGKMAQCVSTLCEYGGFRKASLKLHPDRVKNMEISADEKLIFENTLKLHPDRVNNMEISADEQLLFENTYKLILENTFKFLVNCKTDYKGADGDELTLNSNEEREASCKFAETVEKFKQFTETVHVPS